MKSAVFSSILALLLCCYLADVEAQSIQRSKDQMTATATEVLNRLKQAKGILPHEAPHVLVKEFRGSDRLGRAILEEGIIELQDEAYLRCVETGKDSIDALAWLMGHELGHFIHKHSETNHNLDNAAPGLLRDQSVRGVAGSVVGISKASEDAFGIVTNLDNISADATLMEGFEEQRESIIKSTDTLKSGLINISEMGKLWETAAGQITKASSDASLKMFLDSIKDQSLNNATDLKKQLESYSKFENTLKRAIGNYLKKEKEAVSDFEGAILGYLAGYETSDAGVAFIEKAYAHRKTKPSSGRKDYPTKEERIGIINATKSDLQSVRPLFEMANYLAAIEQFDDALAYYQKITDKFESRELYNNMGVMSLKEAMRCFEKAENLTRFEFPLVLDVESRIIAASKDVNNPAAYDFRFAMKRVNSAIDYFKKALFYDDEYPEAYLNLSVAQAFAAMVSQQSGFAERINVNVDTFFNQSLVKAQSACYYAIDLLDDIDKAMQGDGSLSNSLLGPDLLRNKKTKSDVFVQLGIVKALQKDTTGADGNFRKAITVDATNSLAIINLRVAMGDDTLLESFMPGTGSGSDCSPGFVMNCEEEIMINGQPKTFKEIIEQDEASPGWVIEKWSNGFNFNGFEVEQQSAVLSKDDYTLYKNWTKNGRGDSTEVSYFLVPTDSYTEPTFCGEIDRKVPGQNTQASTECDVLENHKTFYKSLNVSNGKYLILRPKAVTDARKANTDKIDNAKEVEGQIFHISDGNVMQWVLFYRMVKTDSPSG